MALLADAAGISARFGGGLPRLSVTGSDAEGQDSLRGALRGEAGFGAPRTGVATLGPASPLGRQLALTWSLQASGSSHPGSGGEC